MFPIWAHFLKMVWSCFQCFLWYVLKMKNWKFSGISIIDMKNIRNRIDDISHSLSFPLSLEHYNFCFPFFCVLWEQQIINLSSSTLKLVMLTQESLSVSFNIVSLSSNIVSKLKSFLLLCCNPILFTHVCWDFLFLFFYLFV